METGTAPLSNLSVEERRALLLPAAVTALLVEVLLIADVLMPVGVYAGSSLRLWVGIGSICYTLLLFSVLYPLSERHRGLHWVISAVNGVLIAWLAGFGSVPIAIVLALLVVLLTVSAIMSGRWPTYLQLVFSVGLGYLLLIQTFPSTLEGWATLFSLPFLFAMLIETIMRLKTAIGERVRRLETLNRVARKIGSTIDIQEVIAQVSAAVQDALSADTYFFGVLHEEKIRLELFYDDGEFFPPTELSLEDSLTGWVITNRASLLLRDVIKEVPKRQLKVKVIGKSKSSLSWMGTPLITGGRVLGLMALAAYERGAFNEGDLELLESVAHQAALAIDNAYHHKEVLVQSRLDSLTQVYNHRYFLERLNEEAQRSLETGKPLSLIMLDIDRFKEYNDRFGHLIGDEVLVRLAKTIRRYIKNEDAVGRWGGEEFAVFLCNASSPQALLVAERIRKTLARISMKSREGACIPAPTVSQGIAYYPFETDQVENLIHLADTRLYIAKARGRNQVETALPEIYK